MPYIYIPGQVTGRSIQSPVHTLMLFKQFPRAALFRLSSTYLHISPRLLTASFLRMATKDACGAAPGTHATHKPLPKEEAWKYRPPYLIQSPEDFGEIKWRGKCHCGQISYLLNMERPLKAKFCHCRGCQLMHGAPFQWAAIFPKSSITFDRGVRGLEFYCSSHYTREYEVPAKVSCSYCRTPIMDEGRNVCLLFPESIEFGKDEEDFERVRECFEVSSHIFYSKRMVEIPDGKPKWAGMDEASELLDDYGNPKPE